MKILMVNKYLYPKGGSETYMFQLAELLLKQGHSVEFWGMNDKKNSVPDTYKSFVDNIDFVMLKGARNKIKAAVSTIYSLVSRKKIDIVLKNFKPDIVHIHNYNFQLTPAILPIIKKSGAKVIHTTHDSQLVCPYHRLYNFQRESICTKCVGSSFWHCVTDRCFDGSLFKSAVGAFESYLYHGLDYYNRYIDVFISPSKFFADKISSRINKKILVIPNFTEDKTILPDDLQSNYVLYFGRISSEKGILELQNEFIKSKVKLMIIGSGPEEGMIQHSPYIEYLGPKYGDDLLKYISGAKFVLQPSRWLENCPMTVIESFMCGTPVIASKKGGFIEMIQEAENGFLLNFESPDDKKRLWDIIQMDTDQMRDNCRQTYLRKYNPEQHFIQINKVYNEVLNASI